GLIEIVQTEAYAPIHVRKGEGSRGLRLAVDNDAIDQTEVAETVEGEAEPEVDEPETEAHRDDVSPTTDADGETHE
ncbi:MAG TPA: hypothetical protein VFZ95_01940, partial [Steroidobacteraceae bacterium]